MLELTFSHVVRIFTLKYKDVLKYLYSKGGEFVIGITEILRVVDNCELVVTLLPSVRKT